MKLKIPLLTIFILFISQQSFSEDSFPFIGLTPNGKAIEIPFSKKKWKKKMEKSITYISQSALNSLERIENKKRSLTFDQVDIGSYVKIGLGLGNIVKGSIEPYFKLFFKKNKTNRVRE